MARVEVCSRHIGNIVVTTRGGKREEIVFKDCSTASQVMGVAEVDEDVAIVLLEDVGLPDYFKSGPIVVKDDGEKEDLDKKDEPPLGSLTKESYAGIGNANTLKAALKTCVDRDLLMDLISGETQGQNRETFIKALNTQLDTLN